MCFYLRRGRQEKWIGHHVHGAVHCILKWCSIIYCNVVCCPLCGEFKQKRLELYMQRNSAMKSREVGWRWLYCNSSVKFHVSSRLIDLGTKMHYYLLHTFEYKLNWASISVESQLKKSFWLSPFNTSRDICRDQSIKMFSLFVFVSCLFVEFICYLFATCVCCLFVAFVFLCLFKKSKTWL